MYCIVCKKDVFKQYQSHPQDSENTAADTCLLNIYIFIYNNIYIITK